MRWPAPPPVLTSLGMSAIPALIVSGFLGSGKTTLVGHLLREAQREGVRLAIISNEFGDTGIDRALLEAGDEGFVELDGGCVCCRLSDALGETLEQILTTIRPDRLVLETSGVALPGDVLVQFWRPPVSDLISEEVVVVLVDAERILQDEEHEATFLDQIEAADLLLLNKCDLVDEAGLQRAEERLRELSGGQPVLRTVRSEIAPSLLFPPDPEGARQERRQPDATPAPHTHEQFNTRELLFPEGVAEEEVLTRIAAEGAVRAKGFVRTSEGLRLVQGVGQRIELTEPDRPIREELIGKVVIIHQEKAGV